MHAHETYDLCMTMFIRRHFCNKYGTNFYKTTRLKVTTIHGCVSTKVTMKHIVIKCYLSRFTMLQHFDCAISHTYYCCSVINSAFVTTVASV